MPKRLTLIMIHNQFVIKVNVICTKIPSTSELVTETQYDSDKQGLERKIEHVDKNITNTSGLIEKTDYDTKITEIEIIKKINQIKSVIISK